MLCVRSCCKLLCCITGTILSLIIPISAFSENCLPSIRVVFSEDGLSVTAQSNKALSNVVLKFCDGSNDYKFDNLSAHEQTFTYDNKVLAGIWVKSGCNKSGDGPGYGEFFGRECTNVVPTPTPTPLPEPTPTPELILICYNPNGSSTNAEQRYVTAAELAALPTKDYTLGKCPVDCMGIPGGNAAIDICGKCGGDGTSCLDCAGIPNGNAVRDVCGICNGDGKSCLGCDNIPNSGKVFDVCGVCGGDSSTCKDCMGVPNGQTKVDQCGICGGNNSSCLDCNGTPNGSNRIDVCGVCGGDGSTCIGGEGGCKGTIDLCGVCDGNNACLDCNGVPNGGASYDCCGICGGNGDPKNCPELCKVYDTGKIKRQYLRRIRALYSSIRTYSLREQGCKKSSSAPKSRIAKGTILFKESTKLLASFISNKIKVCNTQWCAKTSFTSVLSTLQVNTKNMYKLSKSSQYDSINACGVTKSTGSSPRTSSTYKQAVGSLGKIPASQCSN